MNVQQQSDQDLGTSLCCPCYKRSKIIVVLDELYCISKECNYSEHCFPKVSGKPILIDFTNSVCTLESFKTIEDGSVLQRKRSPVQNFLKRIIWGTSQKTVSNCKKFINLLLQDSASPRLLVVGGGSVGSGSDFLYSQSNVEVISFDIYASPYTDFVADAHGIPIPDTSVDGVWVQAVLEHVLDPVKVVQEIHRVLKPNGIVYAETPFMQQVHEKAYDFTRFTESGHRWLFKNFDLIDSGSVLGAGVALLWSIRYFFSAILRSKKIGLIFSVFFFWLRFFDYLIPQSYTSDAASSIFFLGRKSENVLLTSEIIEFYRGVR